jgi:hypothetical protein
VNIDQDLSGDDLIAAKEIQLSELRIIYDRLDNDHGTSKTRTITFLAAGLALMSYLYAGGPEELFIPSEPYGRVFYFLGLGLVTAGLSFLLFSLRAHSWSVPIESKINKLGRYRSKAEVLDLLIEEYQESMNGNIGKYERKVGFNSTGFFLLLLGAILLLVIKNIGG